MLLCTENITLSNITKMGEIRKEDSYPLYVNNEGSPPET
jgi:hypothetical protein